MFKKIFSIMLTCAFIFQLSPIINVYGSEITSDFDDFSSKIIYEISEQREENAKYFKLKDGEVLRAKYPIPVHKKSSGGTWQDIYSSQCKSQIEFAEFSGDNKTVSIKNRNYNLSWGYSDAQKIKLQITDDSHAIYKNIYENVDLEYKFSPKNLKENLVLKNSQAQKNFLVTYKLGDLKATQTNDKIVDLVNDSGKSVYKISAPEMFDSNNSHSDKISLKIVNQENDMLTLKIIFDTSWLEAKERLYPIFIDPDYKDEYFDFTSEAFEVICTNYRKKDTNTSVFLNLTGSDFKGIGVVKVAIFGRGGPLTESNCTYNAEYYLLEAGKKYELFNRVHEKGHTETQIRFICQPSQRVTGCWSPDYSPDTSCLTIGNSGGKGNTADEPFNLIISPEGHCWTKIRTKANSSSVYLNLVDSGNTGIVRMSIWGIGGTAQQENCTNKQEFYDLSLGQKYELYNVVKEHNHSGVQLKFEGRPGQKILGKWSPDYVPEAGCITVGSSTSVSDAVAIRPILYPQKPDSIELNVEPISQHPEFPTGCESVSAVMVLHFYDHGIAVREFIDKFLIRKSLTEGPDPNSAFIGNPYKNSGLDQGYGCFAPCIAKAMNKVLSGCRAEVIRGQSLPNIADRYVKNGNPVLLWATMGMKKTSPGTIWTIGYVDENAQFKIGDKFTWPRNEHCIVLIGFNEKDYFVNDPYQTIGRVKGAYEKSLLEQRFKDMGSQAVAVYRTVVPVPKQPVIVSPKPIDLKQEIVKKVQDFAAGLGTSVLANEVEPIFLVTGAITNSSQIQDIPRNVRHIKIGDREIYLMGQITGDILTTIGGIIQTAFGISEIAGGIGGDTVGAGLSSTGVGALAGVPVMVVSGAAVAQGTATAAHGISILQSSLGNLSNDLSQLQENLGCSRGGRHEPTTLREKLAMEVVISNPEKGKILAGKNTDPRWPAEQGWEKRAQNVNGIEIHYQYNPKTSKIDDVKIK